MNLNETGKLFYDLRKAKNMTQKQVADRLGVSPKTVSKWETGHGFPDVSMVSGLADILGVSERILLSGNMLCNNKDAGNVRKTKFYVCPECGNMIQGTGECSIVCCGKNLEQLEAKRADDEHEITVSEIEDDFYIEINHPMTKSHFIKFIAYIGFDRVLTVRLYPEQNAQIRIPRMFRGTFYYYCSEHGLFEYRYIPNKKK